MGDKLIGDLTEKEFTDFLEQHTNPAVHIDIGGVTVASQKNSLKEIEETINRLLKEHKDFLTWRRETKFRLGGFD